MRLLQRSLISYVIYSIIIVLIAIPVFYLIINKMFLNDVDEALYNSEKQLVQRLNNEPEENILKWNSPDKHIIITPVSQFSKNSEIQTMSLFNAFSHEEEDFRQLSSIVLLHNKPYLLTFRISLVDSEDLSQGVITTQIILLIVLLAGLILLTLWQSKKIWKPFYTTLGQLKLFELDKHSTIKLDKTNIHEFDELNNAIKQLTEKDHHAYLQQKEFTANAAHELQTPLAVMQAKLELMMQEKNLSEERVKHIQSLSQSVTRMTKLNKGLLLLTKIENNQFKDIQRVDISLLIKRALQQSASPLESKRLRLTESCEKTRVYSNPVLADILISNLVNNAILHTPTDGEIRIICGNEKVEISNSGQPLPFQAEDIFHRFQKGNHPKASEGNGLGLAIVKQICDTCHFDISYTFK
ncbi:MAG: sensor histidine kinase, partial [Chitinophagaceae bacterium]